MARIHLDQDIRSLTEFRTGVTSYLKQVRQSKRPLVITQHGRGVAVLLDVSAYEALIERLEVLEDIHQAEAQIDQGMGVEHDKAKAKVRKRLGLQ